MTPALVIASADAPFVPPGTVSTAPSREPSGDDDTEPYQEGQSEEEEEEEEEEQLPVVTLGEGTKIFDHDPDGEGDEEDITTSEADIPDGEGARRRKKTPCVFLNDEQERMLGEWLQEHPFLYDRGMAEFKEAAKKTRLLEEKARTLNPPLTGNQLSTWLRSIRTRFGRLTKVKSGQAARDLTSREKWILKEFAFFGKHIVRQKQPKTLGLKQVRKVFISTVIIVCLFFFTIYIKYVFKSCMNYFYTSE